MAPAVATSPVCKVIVTRSAKIRDMDMEQLPSSSSHLSASTATIANGNRKPFASLSPMTLPPESRMLRGEKSMPPPLRLSSKMSASSTFMEPSSNQRRLTRATTREPTLRKFSTTSSTFMEPEAEEFMHHRPFTRASTREPSARKSSIISTEAKKDIIHCPFTTADHPMRLSSSVSNASTLEQEPDVTPRRGRGRPPTRAVNGNSSAIFGPRTQTVNGDSSAVSGQLGRLPVEPDPPVARRGRGRPPTQTGNRDSSTVSSQMDTLPLPLPKKLMCDEVLISPARSVSKFESIWKNRRSECKLVDGKDAGMEILPNGRKRRRRRSRERFSPDNFPPQFRRSKSVRSPLSSPRPFTLNGSSDISAFNLNGDRSNEALFLISEAAKPIQDHVVKPVHQPGPKQRQRKPRSTAMLLENGKFPGIFQGQHPFVSLKSRRTAAEDTAVVDLPSALPAVLTEKSLLSVLTSSDVIATQSNVVHAKWKGIVRAKLLLRRRLTYNVSAKHYKLAPTHESRSVATKKRSLECCVQQLWKRKEGGKNGLIKLEDYPHPVELEVTSLSLLKPKVEIPTVIVSPMKKEIDLQIGVLKKNPKETLQRDLLHPVLTNVPKMRGMATAGKVVNFGKQNKVRLECWNKEDFLVVNMEPVRQMGKIVAFNIADLKEGLALEVPGHFSLRIIMRKAPVSQIKIVDYNYVMIYATGQHYQVRDMVTLRHHLKGHSCILCGVRCDSLCTLMRHIDGLHPSVGHQYDDDLKRLYIWFAPEHDFVRAPVPGLVDHWGVLKYRMRDDGMTIMFPESSPGFALSAGRAVFQWRSARYRPNQSPDSLPTFDINQVLKVYGMAVNPARQYLHTNPVQTIRPCHNHLRDYDSDEDCSWQDEYEQEKIHDFIDCNPQEKQFMCLWNSFTRHETPIFSIYMKDVMCRFVVQHAMEIEMAEAYPALCAQLSMFRRDGIITPAESLEVVTRYRNTLLCLSQLGKNNGTTSSGNADLSVDVPGKE